MALHAEDTVFGIITGRNKSTMQEALRRYDLPPADIFICSVGTEIYYSRQWIKDLNWETYISYEWDREGLYTLLQGYPSLYLQEAAAQTPFKLSYYVDKRFDGQQMIALRDFMSNNKMYANSYLTSGRYLDIVPIRSGKGNAVKYISRSWMHPPDKIITAGNGGNDIDMLSGYTKSIVVANHDRELKVLQHKSSVYFSKSSLSEGVREGVLYHCQSKKRIY